MKKNALLEAAAEILKQSHSGAPKEPMHKAPGEVQDLGGTTPYANVGKKLEPGVTKATPPGKPADSSTEEPLHKVSGGATEIDPLAQGTEENEEEAERKRRIEAGLAAGDLREEKEDEDEDEEDEDEDDDKKDKKDKKDVMEGWKQALKEDVSAILASESGLSKEFSSKIGTIYEARVTDKVMSIQESIEEEYAQRLEEAVLEIRDSLTEQMNDYLDYVVEEWMKQNEIAIEKGLRSELTEEFIGGLRDLFTEHYIDIPSEKVDLVDELATKVEELTGALNEEVAKSVELKKQLSESKKSEILVGVCEGLTQTQTEKIRTLAESVEFTAEGDYTQKVSTIRENYFPVAKGTKVNAKVLTEATEPLAEETAKPIIADADVARVAAALSKFTK